MELNKNQLISGGIGVLLGASSVLGIESLFGNGGNTISPFAAPSAFKSKTTMYERVEQDESGDVYVTPKGKKYHRVGCYILRKAHEIKRVSSSDAMDEGYMPCSKCNP
jgi:hypothetical protein